MQHLVKIIGKDKTDNAKGVHVSGLLKRNIILRRSGKMSFKYNDLFSCRTLISSENAYFVNQGDWEKVKTLEEEFRLRSQGEIKRIFYDSQNGDVVVTGLWNNLNEFEDLKKIERLGVGVLNERVPLMYVHSNIADPSKFYDIFDSSRKKTVLANFGGRLPEALNGERDIKSVMELLSKSYS
jgi:hypothetical protein